MSYLDDLQLMPPEIQKIAMLCWDDTGRPREGATPDMAIVNLLNLCDDYDEYVMRFKQMFGETLAVNPSLLTTHWACYMSGMQRAVKALEALV